MLIEILYAELNGVQQDIIAHPVGETPRWWNLHRLIQEKLGINCVCNKKYDDLIDTLCTGEECEYEDFSFGWKTLEYQND